MFQDRVDAGQQLAVALEGYREAAPLVLGVPRGGVVVAYQVARALGAPLDLVIARKLGAPEQPELAIGAVVSGDHIRILNTQLVQQVGATPEYLEAVTQQEFAEIERRMRAYRGDRPLPEVEGRTVILIDDGIATGYTLRAAIEGLRRQGVGRLVVAVPVAPRETAAALRHEADDVVCLQTPEPFYAVGMWYEDFSQTEDEEVVQLLAAAATGEAREE